MAGTDKPATSNPAAPLPLPSQRAQRKQHKMQRRFILAGAGVMIPVLVGVATQKWGTEVPNWLLLVLCLLPLSLLLYWLWTHEKIEKHRRDLIYTYPAMSLVIMVLVGALAGGAFGVLLWLSAHAEAKTPRETEALRAAQPEPAQTLLRGILIPANDAFPPGVGDIIPERNMVFFIGNVLVFASSPAATILKIAGEDMLSFEKTSDGIYLNAIVRNDNDQEVARVIKNVVRVQAGSGYYAEQPDSHTLIVLTPDDQKALYVRYMNPSAMKVLGIFKHQGRQSITIEEGKEIPGNPFPLSDIPVFMGSAGVLVEVD